MIGSGKTHTMFGAMNQNGILSRSVEYIITNRKKNINVSVVELDGNIIYSLTNGKSKIQKVLTAPKANIGSLTDFNSLVEKVLKIRNQKRTNQNATSSRSHLVFYFSIENSPADMAFIDLAGFESPDLKENINETKFINKSLFGLNMVLENITRGILPSYDSDLSKIFRPYLTKGSKTCLLYHISNISAKKGLEYIKNVAASSKTAKRINPDPSINDSTTKILRM